MGAGQSSSTATVSDLEWLRLASDVNLVENAVSVPRNSEDAVSGSADACKYCLSPNHPDNLCTVAIRCNLIKFDDINSSKQSEAKDVASAASLLEAAEGLVQLRPIDNDDATALLTDSLFNLSVLDSAFHRLDQQRQTVVLRLRQAIANLDAASSITDISGSSAGAGASDDSAASAVTMAVFQSFISIARSLPVNPAGPGALEGDIVTRLLAFLRTRPDLDLYSAGSDTRTAWLSDLEDWLKLVSASGGGVSPVCADARSALLHLAACRGSLHAVLHSAVSVLDTGAQLRADGVKRLVDLEAQVPLPASLVDDGTTASSALLGTWTVDPLPGEKLVTDDDDNVESKAPGSFKPAPKTHPDVSASASDGRFLYLLNSAGLRKVGTGYQGTVRGRCYAWVPQVCDGLQCWLAVVGSHLYVRPAVTPADGCVALIYDTATLQETGRLNMPDVPVSSDESPAPMFSSGNNLYIVTNAVLPDNDTTGRVLVIDPVSSTVLREFLLKGPGSSPIHRQRCGRCMKVGWSGIAYKCTECERYYECGTCHAEAMAERAFAPPIAPKKRINTNGRSKVHDALHSMVPDQAALQSEDAILHYMRVPTFRGAGPKQCINFAGTALGNTFYMFGGGMPRPGSNQVLSCNAEFWAYDSGLLRWRDLTPADKKTQGGDTETKGEDPDALQDEKEPTDDAEEDEEDSGDKYPAARQQSSLTSVVVDGQQYLLMFGGSTGTTETPTDELYLYNVAANTWRRVPTQNKPNARRSHAAAFVPGTVTPDGEPWLIVYGGLGKKEDAAAAPAASDAPQEDNEDEDYGGFRPPGADNSNEFYSDMWVLPLSKILATPAEGDAEAAEVVAWRAVEFGAELPSMMDCSIFPALDDETNALKLLVIGGTGAAGKALRVMHSVTFPAPGEATSAGAAATPAGSVTSPVAGKAGAAAADGDSGYTTISAKLKELNVSTTTNMVTIFQVCACPQYTDVTAPPKWSTMTVYATDARNMYGQLLFSSVALESMQWRHSYRDTNPNSQQPINPMSQRAWFTTACLGGNLTILGGISPHPWLEALGICPTIVEMDGSHTSALTPSCLSEGLFYANNCEMGVAIPACMSPNSALANVTIVRRFRLTGVNAGTYLSDTFAGMDGGPTDSFRLTGYSSLCFDATNDIVWHWNSPLRLLSRWTSKHSSAIDITGITTNAASILNKANLALRADQDITVSGVSAASVLLASIDQLVVSRLPKPGSLPSVTVSPREPFCVDVSFRTFALLDALLQSLLRLRPADDADSVEWAYCVQAAVRLVELNVHRLVAGGGTAEDLLTSDASDGGINRITSLRDSLMSLVHRVIAGDAASAVDVAIASGAVAALAAGLNVWFPSWVPRESWLVDIIRDLAAHVSKDRATVEAILHSVTSRLIHNRTLSMLVARPTIDDANLVSSSLSLRLTSGTGEDLSSMARPGHFRESAGPLDLLATAPNGAPFLVSQVHLASPSLAQHASPLSFGIVCVWNTPNGAAPALSEVDLLNEMTAGKWADVAPSVGKSHLPSEATNPTVAAIRKAWANAGLVGIVAFMVKPGETARVQLPTVLTATHVHVKFVRGPVKGAFGLGCVRIIGVSSTQMQELVGATDPAPIVPPTPGSPSLHTSPIADLSDLLTRTLQLLVTESVSWLSQADIPTDSLHGTVKADSAFWRQDPQAPRTLVYLTDLLQAIQRQLMQRAAKGGSSASSTKVLNDALLSYSRSVMSAAHDLLHQLQPVMSRPDLPAAFFEWLQLSPLGTLVPSLFTALTLMAQNIPTLAPRLLDALQPLLASLDLLVVRHDKLLAPAPAIGGAADAMVAVASNKPPPAMDGVSYDEYGSARPASSRPGRRVQPPRRVNRKPTPHWLVSTFMAASRLGGSLCGCLIRGVSALEPVNDPKLLDSEVFAAGLEPGALPINALVAAASDPSVLAPSSDPDIQFLLNFVQEKGTAGLLATQMMRHKPKLRGLAARLAPKEPHDAASQRCLNTCDLAAMAAVLKHERLITAARTFAEYLAAQENAASSTDTRLPANLAHVPRHILAMRRKLVESSKKLAEEQAAKEEASLESKEDGGKVESKGDEADATAAAAGDAEADGEAPAASAGASAGSAAGATDAERAEEEKYRRQQKLQTSIRRTVIRDLTLHATVRALFMVCNLAALPAATVTPPMPPSSTAMARSTSAVDDSAPAPPALGPSAPKLARARSHDTAAYDSGETSGAAGNWSRARAALGSVVGVWRSLAELEEPTATLAEAAAPSKKPAGRRQQGIVEVADILDLVYEAQLPVRRRAGKGLLAAIADDSAAAGSNVSAIAQFSHALAPVGNNGGGEERYCQTCSMYYPSFETGDSVCQSCGLCALCSWRRPKCEGASAAGASPVMPAELPVAPTTEFSELPAAVGAACSSLAYIVSLLQAREKRARARAVGLQSILGLLQHVANVPAKQQLVANLAPALRFSAGATNKQGLKSRHHYTDGVRGCGRSADAALRTAFHSLFTFLAELLSPRSSADADTRLAVLSSWGMHFQPCDYTLLERVGIMTILRRFMDPASVDLASPSSTSGNATSEAMQSKLADAASLTFRIIASAVVEPDAAEAAAAAVTSKDVASVVVATRKDLNELQKLIIEIIFAELSRASGGIEQQLEAIRGLSQEELPIQLLEAALGGKGSRKRSGDDERGEGDEGDEEGGSGDEDGNEDDEDAEGGAGADGRQSPIYDSEYDEENPAVAVVAADEDDKDDVIEASRADFAEFANKNKVDGAFVALDRHRRSARFMLQLMYSLVTRSQTIGRYLATARFLLPLMDGMQSGLPGTQRLAMRMLRVLLPTLPVTTPNFGAAVLPKLLGLVGTAWSGAKQVPLSNQVGARLGRIEQAFAAEVVGLVRVLWQSEAWVSAVSDALQAAVVAGVPAFVNALSGYEVQEGTPGLFVPGSEVLPRTSVLKAFIGAVAVMGGLRDTYREGGAVRVTQKGLLGTQAYEGVVVSFDRAEGRLRFVDRTRPATDDAHAEQAAADEPNTPSQVRTVDADGTVVVLEEVEPNIKGFVLKTDTLHALRSLFQCQAATGASGASSLLVSQILSMTLRALSKLLQHPPTVHAFLSMGLGPDIVQFAEAASAVSADDASSSLASVELLSVRLAEECTAMGLLNVQYRHSEMEALREEMARSTLQKIPYSPLQYCALGGAQPPNVLHSKLDCVVMESPHSYAITDRLTGYRELVTVIASNPIPPSARSYYFEIQLVAGGQNNGRQTGVTIGLWPESLRGDTRGRAAMPGIAPKSYGWCCEGMLLPQLMQPGKQGRNPNAVDPKIAFDENDIVGIGWDKRRGQLIFTRNGKRIKSLKCRVRDGVYFPAVGVGRRGARVEVNLGQKPFKYDFCKEHADLLDTPPAGSAAASATSTPAAAADGAARRARPTKARASATGAGASGGADFGDAEDPETAALAANAARNAAGGHAAATAAAGGAAGGAGGDDGDEQDGAVAAGGAAGGNRSNERKNEKRSGDRMLSKLKSKFMEEDSDYSESESEDEGGQEDGEDQPEEEDMEVEFFEDDPEDADANQMQQQNNDRINQLRNLHYQRVGRGGNRAMRAQAMRYDQYGNMIGDNRTDKREPLVLEQVAWGQVVSITALPTRVQLRALQTLHAERPDVAPGPAWSKIMNIVKESYGVVLDVDRASKAVKVLVEAGQPNGLWFTAWLPLVLLKTAPTPVVPDVLTAALQTLDMPLDSPQTQCESMLVLSVSHERRLRALYARECLMAMLAAWPVGLLCTPAPFGGARRLLNVVRPVIVEQVTSSVTGNAKGKASASQRQRKSTLNTLRQYMMNCLSAIINEGTGAVASAEALIASGKSTQSPAEIEEARQTSLDLLDLLVEEVVTQLREAATEEGYLRNGRGGVTTPARDVAVWVLDCLLTVSPLAAIKVYSVDVYLAVMNFMSGQRKDKAVAAGDESDADKGEGSDADEEAAARAAPAADASGDADADGAKGDGEKRKARFARMSPTAIMPLLPLLSRLLSRIGYFPEQFRPNLRRLDWLRREMEARYEKEISGDSGAVAVSAYLCAVVDLMVTVRRTCEIYGMEWQSGKLVKKTAEAGGKGDKPKSLEEALKGATGGDEDASGSDNEGESKSNKNAGRAAAALREKQATQGADKDLDAKNAARAAAAARASAAKAATGGKSEEESKGGRNAAGGAAAAGGGGGATAAAAFGGAGAGGDDDEEAAAAPAAKGAKDKSKRRRAGSEDDSSDGEGDLGSGVSGSALAVDLGPDLSGMGWFDQVFEVSKLMTDMQAGKGLPSWFMRRAWLSTELEKYSVECQSAHPYVSGTPFRKLEIPGADGMIIKLDPATKLSNSDSLLFYKGDIQELLVEAAPRASAAGDDGAAAKPAATPAGGVDESKGGVEESKGSRGGVEESKGGRGGVEESKGARGGHDETKGAGGVDETKGGVEESKAAPAALAPSTSVSGARGPSAAASTSIAVSTADESGTTSASSVVIKDYELPAARIGDDAVAAQLVVSELRAVSGQLVAPVVNDHYQPRYDPFGMPLPPQKQKSTAPPKPKPVKVSGPVAFYKLAIATRPCNHPNMFCGSCRRPISGVRYMCAHCFNFTVCEACEPSPDTSMYPDHDHQVHSMILMRRATNLAIHGYNHPIIAVFPKLYRRKEVSKPMTSDEHTGVTCSMCKSTPLMGVRYHCGCCSKFDVCSACWPQASVEHNLNHVFIKIARPLPVPSRLPKGAFLKNIVSGSVDRTLWGFKFTVTPRFSLAYQADVLRAKQDDLQYAVNTQETWGLQADHQLTEFVSRLCDKLQAQSTNPESQRGGTGRSARHVVSSSMTPLKMSPNDVEVSASEITRYPQLERRKVEDLRLRFAVLRLLNSRVSSLLPLIDWTSTVDDLGLAHTFRRLRGIVFSQLKATIWNRAIECSVMMDMNYRGSFNIRLKRNKPAGEDGETDAAATTSGEGAGAAGDANKTVAADQAAASGREGSLEVNPDLLFVQLAKELLLRPASVLRKNQQPFVVSMEDEAGLDAGGVFRDSLSEMCAELQSTKLPLLIPCPNAVNKVGFTLDKWVPNPAARSPEHLKLFEVLGRLMGIAVRLQEPLQLDLPTIVWKPLVAMEPDVSDLEAIDQVLVKTMRMLQDPAELARSEIDEENFGEHVGATWSYTSASGRVVRLREGGETQPVAWTEKEGYAKAVLAGRLTEFSEQVGAVLKGLTSVIPARILSLLTPTEFEGLVCGSPEVDIDLLKKHTRYSGSSVTDPHIRYFWAALRSFSQSERSMFLRFAWGRSRLPVGANFTDTMSINDFRNPGHGTDDDFLPVSHTCFFSIELPRYTSEETCRAKLLTAITMCTSVEMA